MTGPVRRPGDVLEIALVNNMPDQALAATQTQFARLVRAGAGGRAVRWRCYLLPGLDRSASARRYLERSHEDIEALYRRGADGLIVTGCEPRAARLDHEPYWPQMQKLVDWARVHTHSTIWSCLAAHAATLHLAGIERRRMPEKISGVYACAGEGSCWNGKAQARVSLVPHSRYNDLPRAALERGGFHVASYSSKIGVDMYWREEPSLFVFLQGHPEYDPDTLAKEYRRDVMRFLGGERDTCPAIPEGYFGAETARKLEALRDCATSGDCDDAEAALKRILSDGAAPPDWAGDSARLYEGWLDAISEKTRALRKSA